jgi:adenylate cyclase
MSESIATPPASLRQARGGRVARHPLLRRLRAIDRRQLRFASGLVLFTYVATHFLNHALGLVSLEAMGQGLRWFIWTWRSPPGTLALYGAVAIHFALALHAIFRRRSFRTMAWPEALQLAAGLAIIPMVADHALATRLANALYGVRTSYNFVVGLMAWQQPAYGAWQSATMIVAWLHGCLGLWFWLRLKPWWPRAQPWLFALAIMVPLAGLAGFLAAGQAVRLLARDPQWWQAVLAATNLPDAATVARFGEIQASFHRAFWTLLAATLLARAAHQVWRRRHGMVRIAYPDGREITVARGVSVLEASQANGIPHASVCGGRGRCSTCRVRVSAGGEHLPAPAEREAQVLARIGAPEDVRLACRIRPTHDLTVTPLLPPNAEARAGWAQPAHLHGREMEIAVLFCDIRGFTSLSEHRLPYDTVFLLNRYFLAMGQAIERAGGRVDKFIGDGVMALFGVGASRRAGARSALEAARAMAVELATLNRALEADLKRAIRIGIGVHFGPAIVGEMGYGRVKSLTAIGDTVNTASRLETLTKEYGVQLVVSEAVEQAAGVSLAQFPAHAVQVRGREESLMIRAIADARELPAPEAAAA